KSGDRSVRFVALDDEQAAAGTRVATELRDVPADEEGRVESEPVETESDHPARRRLAVRAGDDDRRAKRDELCEQVGARAPFNAPCVRRRDVDLPAGGRGGRIRGDRDLDSLEVCEVRRLDAVPARDLG